MMKRPLTVIFMLSMLMTWPVSVGAQDLWSDTFVDGSGIESSDDIVLEVTEFGEDFIRDEDNPLLTVRTCDPWGDGTSIPGAVHPSVIYFPEGDGMDGYKYWMVYTPYSPPAPNRDWTWERPTLVRSNDGINWVKTPDYTNPLIGPGSSGQWDDNFLADPDIVYAGEEKGWFLYYAGASPQHIGVATSSDGKNWAKHAGNPIVTQAVPGGPVLPTTRTPSVIYDGTTFHMWYNIGHNEIGYATSADGLNWTPYSGNPVLSPTPGAWDSASISHQDVIYHDGQFWMYYVGGSINYITSLSIGLATSPDGSNWSKYPGNPILTMSTGEWENGCLYHPSPVVVDGEMWLYYTGMNEPVGNESDVYEIGLATSTDGGYVLLEQEGPREYSERPGETIAWYQLNEGFSPGALEYSPIAEDIAWYRFEQDSGTIATDISGNGNDGTLIGGVHWTTEGQVGSALEFDGTGYVQVGDQPILNPTSAITIEAWIYPYEERANNYIVSKYGGTGNLSYGFKVGYQSDLKIHGWIGHGGVLYEAIADREVPVNTWSHVAMTYSASDPEHSIRLYYNGEEVSHYYRRQIVPSDYTINTSTVDLLIGKLPIFEKYLCGKLDELRIVGRALSASEIAADAAVPPDVLDSSENENHGWTQRGTAWTNGMFSSNGLDFDGSTGYVYVPYSPSLNTENELTIEAWINPDHVKDNNYIVSRGDSVSGSYGFKVGYQQDNKIHGWIRSGGDLIESRASIGIPANQWSFVAMTYDSTEGVIKLYYNGEEVPGYDLQEVVVGGGTIDDSTFDLLIGKLEWTSTTIKYVDGKLDEVRVLNRALTPEEIWVDSGRGYEPSGNLTSVLITPPAGRAWDTFYASDECPDGTGIVYSILNDAEDIIAPVASGDDISFLGRTPIRLYGELTTDDPAYTPFLDDWSVTWKDLIIEVDIDIKPGDDPNSINLGSKGVIPLAILSTADFDATQVDPGTVTLAGAGVALRGKASKLMTHQEDVNGDGLIDLVVQVETENLDSGQFQDGFACLEGMTYGGEPIRGCDEIVIVPSG